MNAYLDERVEVPNHILVRERPQQAYFFQALRSRCFRFAAIAAAATAARAAAAGGIGAPADFLQGTRQGIPTPGRVKHFRKAAAPHGRGGVRHGIVGQTADGAAFVEGRRQHRVRGRLHFRPDVQNELLETSRVL